jgi:hypothetical protein
MHRVGCAVAGLVGVIALGGCASKATSEQSIARPGSAMSATSSAPTTTSVASTAATCGSVGTHDLSTTTALYSADPGALPCLTQAVAACRLASLEISQTAVDVGDDYLLTIIGASSDGCDARLADSGFGLGPASPEPITADCTARIQDAAVLIACPEGSYVLPSTVVSPSDGLFVAPSGAPRPGPPLSSTFARPKTEGPTSYPTGNNAEVLAVATDAAGQPVLTLLIPRTYCPAMFYGITAVPAPTGGPCVVTFDAGTGKVGPGNGTTPDLNAACPMWPTPQVTFVVDSPPATGCKPDVPPVAGLHPGAIGWLVEGGGVPYFVLADGVEIHPPMPPAVARPNPSTAPTP